MSKRARLRPLHRALVDEIRRAGFEPIVERTNGGHVRFCWPGGPTIVAWSPSDRRSFANARANIRRAIRACSEAAP
jgi:hypothetical protein